MSTSRWIPGRFMFIHKFGYCGFSWSVLPVVLIQDGSWHTLLSGFGTFIETSPDQLGPVQLIYILNIMSPIHTFSVFPNRKLSEPLPYLFVSNSKIYIATYTLHRW